jgi:hypothetical protein
LICRDIKKFYRIWSFVFATLSRHFSDSKSLIEWLSSKSRLTASNHLKKIRFLLTRSSSLLLRQSHYLFASEYEFSFWVLWVFEALDDLEVDVSLSRNVRHLQNRKSAEDGESRFPPSSLFSRLSLSLSWVKRENVCQSTTIKWSIFDSIEWFFKIIVKYFNFSTHSFVVSFNRFQENASFIKNNYSNIFVFCSLLDVDVSSTNFMTDVFDEFNVNLNDDFIYRISEESAFFRIFKNNANDVIIINNKIHLIIMNDVFVICFLNNVFVYISRLFDHCIMFSSSDLFFIYHYLSYILCFIVSIHILHFVVLQRRFSQMRSNNDRLFILFHSFFFSDYEAVVILLRSNIMFVLELLKIFQRILFI